MGLRVTITIPYRVREKIDILALEWGVSRSQAIKRLLGVGLVIVEEKALGHEIFTKSDETECKIVFPDV